MEKFKFITHSNNDAYFNLASEEYLLKQTNGYYFYLWINSPAVIVGLNQNTLQEVNLAYTENSDIKVVRRLTGGGAVYHDNGNLCYTIIAPYEQNENNYRKFTAPIIEYLNQLGVKAEFSGRNDLTIGGQKISGNAQTVYKDRIMHHGTILFNSDMSVLTRALNPSKLKIESKGIKSIRARVTNILEHLKTPITIEEFKKGLEQKFLSISEKYDFTDNDLKKINQLVNEKYSKYEWNIGQSPKGEYNFEYKFDFGILGLNFNLIKGKVENAKIYGDFFSFNDVCLLAEQLNGSCFCKKEFRDKLKDAHKYINGANCDIIVDKIFTD